MLTVLIWNLNNNSFRIMEFTLSENRDAFSNPLKNYNKEYERILLARDMKPEMATKLAAGFVEMANEGYLFTWY